jgi:hypothetical protein
MTRDEETISHEAANDPRRAIGCITAMYVHHKRERVVHDIILHPGASSPRHRRGVLRARRPQKREVYTIEQGGAALGSMRTSAGTPPLGRGVQLRSQHFVDAK